MKLKTLFAIPVVAMGIVACGGGDINLNPTNDSSVNVGGDLNQGGSSGGPAPTNPCATYQKAGQTFAGTFDGQHCTYAGTFVSDSNPLTEDLFIPALANGGIHIFADSLWVGEDVNQNAASAGVRVPQDGEGPALSIAPGALIAFQAPADYVRIARGSRILAEGTASQPIIFSAVDDLRDNSATEADRGLWGGIQINGNGITNKCTDDQRSGVGAVGANVHNCHVTAEGRPATYGGNNNGESSGVLKYVVIKHAGYEVVDGDELNGLTLNGVGSGTVLEFVQTYTTQDDGFEMFGGAVNLKNIVAVNVGDDSIDYSEGYVGNIQFALVVHTSGANRCIEGDNTGEGRADDLTPLTKLRISNMTCITSSVDTNAGDFPSSKGDSEGPLFREGVFFELYNSIVTSNADGMSSNECIEFDDTEGPQTIDAMEAGWSTMKSNFIACTEATKMGAVDVSNAAFDLDAWIDASNVIVDDTNAGDLPVVIVEGLDASDTAYITAAAFSDGNGGAITVTPYDVTMLDDSFAAAAIPAEGDAGESSFFESVDFIGAVSADDDWVAGWTVGL